jgi:hypothetical protein
VNLSGFGGYGGRLTDKGGFALQTGSRNALDADHPDALGGPFGSRLSNSIHDVKDFNQSEIHNGDKHLIDFPQRRA